jgi:formylglycine-generating enzyme required for sulfatase activity
MILAAALVLTAEIAQAVTIDVVPVGNPGNANDNTGYGSVADVYAIGKYEITAGQYCEFLNAVADADAYGLYNPSMADPTTYWLGCNIQRSGSAGSYNYSVASDWANRPVNYVSWGDAARFCNWLHNGQPTGAQDLSTTEDGAYYLNGATSSSALMAIVRKADAKWWIPSENEWYKAAYHKNDGVTGNYFDYPTGSDSVPSKDLVEPTDPGNNATFYDYDNGYTIGSPYYRTEVGAHENSESPYDTFDQGGNVWEWNETAVADSLRGMRGGSFDNSSYFLLSFLYVGDSAAYEYNYVGFRVASVPEPGGITLLLCVAISGLIWLRCRK